MRADATIDKIKSLCEEKKWSLYDLSRNSGVPINTVYGLNHGNKPTLDTLQRYCDGFQITLAEFFSDHEDPESIISPTEWQFVKDMRQLTDEHQARVKGYMKALGDEPMNLK